MLLMMRKCPLCREDFEGPKCPNCSEEANLERLMHDAFRRFLIDVGQDAYLRIEAVPEAPEDIEDPVDREREWDDE
jgi:hypothetical protein